ncbi:pullulanase-type alpha-1,6-glucosidase [Actinoplanes friuliensis]|uniref:alpha-amylase n=1 Tax=Actinoplanes friuliensis DSM 7358 TaxID=1246995 RepID=U5VUI1_9ACTN|nr:pullulanase-type alpha-1,6-glucosidase [Actinoplanes friuliensis]AGZ40477.1 putative glycosyl hydrolase [Actinoplanes friuliensis DSM 7358]
MTTIEIDSPEVSTALSRPSWLVVHYRREDEGYGDWSLHAWGDIAPGAITGFPGGHPFAGEDAYGRFAWVRLADVSREVGFLVVDHTGAKDVAQDRLLDPAVTPEIWLRPGDPEVYPSAAAAGFTEELPGGDDVAVIHYRRADGDYAGWGLHAWEGTPKKPVWSIPLAPVTFDAFGAVFRVPVRPDAAGLRFVVHQGDHKDLPDDQRLDLTRSREVWMLAGTAAPVLPDLRSLGPELDPARALAVFLDRTTVALPPQLAELASAFALVAAPTGGLRRDGDELTGESTTLPLTPRPGGLFQAQSRHFPHLRSYRAFAVPELGDAALGHLLRGQLLAVGRDLSGRVTVVTALQLPGVLDDLYADAADAELGVVLDEEKPTISVWAPTARTVSLELSRTPGDDEPKILEMDRDNLTGIWSIAGKRKWLGRYYRYRVEVWHPAAQAVVTSSVTDPYSLSLSAGSTHSQLVDLSDPELMPPGWESLVKPPAVAPARMQITELHVRDFSIADTTVPAAERGTFLAFTHTESAGMRHLRMLADAGLTHAHLLPAFDFASVPDRRADQAVPKCDLAALPPDSPEQQRAVMAVADEDGFNWGYDPLHYTTPEGSFAVEPAGSSRILEFRRMVAALNEAGLRVVMDVVYNHTMADGLAPFSVLDRVVPGYYHRLLDDGTVAESTCCSNTAPEHMMMGRLVVDSIVTWARDYKVDGFRFDLMGHHPRANILETRVTLDHLDPGIYLYGEGWNFGEIAYDSRFVQATQVNMAGTGVGTFNDRLRDAVRGGGSFGDDPSEQGFATGLGARTPLSVHDRIKVGLSGGLATYRFVTHTGAEHSGSQIDYNGSPSGYAASPGESVTYVDAHDNEILYDAMAFKLPPSLPMADRVRMQVLALSIVVLGQGVGFVALGTERLRSKSLDRNSYNSGDWFNQLRWDSTQGNGFGIGLPPAPDNEDKWSWARPLLADPSLIPSAEMIDLTAARYAEMLRIRRASPVFGLPTADEVQRRLTFPLGGPSESPGVIVMCLDGSGLDHRWSTHVVVFNATEEPTVQFVPELAEVPLHLHPELAASADTLLRTSTAEGGTLTVPARSVAVFVADLAG